MKASVKFNRTAGADFYQTLKLRVNEYFESRQRSRFADWRMVLKTIAMLGLYFVPYFLIVTSVITNYWLVFATWMVMGLGVAGIGMSVMHDANHGAYSRHSWVNALFGGLLNLLGANVLNWKIQHNMLHHTYTNIEGMDEDINPGIILRISPHKKRYRIHKYQHIYGWFVYSLMLVSWLSVKEFKQLISWRGEGYFEAQGTTFGKALATLIFNKIFYYGYALVLPLVLTPSPWWLTVAAFVTMHLMAGFILAVVFQAAHTVPESEFPLPDDKQQIENSWAIHQLLTTSNFAPKNWLLSWYVGGLNFQIEHHLFSNICHVHYPKLSQIVQATAREFGVPYHVQPTFRAALRSHGSFLKQMGRVD